MVRIEGPGFCRGLSDSYLSQVHTVLKNLGCQSSTVTLVSGRLNFQIDGADKSALQNKLRTELQQLELNIQECQDRQKIIRILLQEVASE